jgi:predicted amidohydrolase
MAPTQQVNRFKVAAAHAAPVFMNKAATIKKCVSLIEQAAREDVKLLVFPETFVPGYPVRVAFRFKIMSLHFFISMNGTAT